MTGLVDAEIARLDSLAALIAATGDPDEAVHRTRTGIKRLRAFLRLAGRSPGTDAFRFENGALRDTARLLAPARDAFVVVETAGTLGADDATLAALTAEHAREMRRFDHAVRAGVLDRLGAASERWRSVMRHDPDDDAVAAGLVRTYRRGRKAFETARASRSAAAFHRWRRRVKDLRYQLELLDAPEAVVDPLRTLGDDLGAEHDRTVLIEVAEARNDAPGFSAVAERSARDRSRLRSRALAAGAASYAPEPEAFLASVAGSVGLDVPASTTESLP